MSKISNTVHDWTGILDRSSYMKICTIVCFCLCTVL
ncbi:hypothetical protein OIU78_027356 [Salix suchowensis]|nr:hypothetical protein OIU78_027356 [Salix suchowensis]